MPNVPAYCPNCGAIFPAPISLGGGARIVIENCVTNCPRCGHIASMDGEFVGLENAIHIIRSASVTPERLQAFAKLLRDVYDQKVPLEEAKGRAENIDPALGKAVDSLQNSGSKGALKALVVGLIFALSQCKYDVKVSMDVNELIQQLSRKDPKEIVTQIPMPKPDPRRVL
ncbi:putative C2H2 Zn-finger protein [Bradyrhizobium japonicum]